MLRSSFVSCCCIAHSLLSSSFPTYQSDLARPSADHRYLRSEDPHLHRRSLRAPDSSCARPSGVRANYVVSQPNPIGITVDGLTDDWDLAEAGYDFVTNMTNSGKTDQPVKAVLYLRWNCEARTLCALVKTLPGVCLDGTEQWFKDYDISSDPVLPIKPPDMVNVVENGGSNIVGWEGQSVPPREVKDQRSNESRMQSSCP